jgi:hypothetical protein
MTENAPTEPLPAAYLRRIWERMIAAFPNRWAPSMGESPQGADGQLTVAGDTWARALGGLTTSQLAKGLDASVATATGWPPTLPEFKARALGIPSFSEVKAQLADRSGLRHPFTIATWRRLDSWSYRQAPELVADKLLRCAYDDTHAAVMAGQALPEPELQLTEEPAAKPARDPAVARAALADLAQHFGQEPRP